MMYIFNCLEDNYILISSVLNLLRYKKNADLKQMCVWNRGEYFNNLSVH